MQCIPTFSSLTCLPITHYYQLLNFQGPEGLYKWQAILFQCALTLIFLYLRLRELSMTLSIPYVYKELANSEFEASRSVTCLVTQHSASQSEESAILVSEQLYVPLLALLTDLEKIWNIFFYFWT